jgi:LysR family carnitine catabolism transcriptional activator
MLPGMVLEFMNEHPRIAVNIIDVPGDEVIDAIRTKRADIGLTHTHPEPDIDNTLIMEDRLVLVGQLRHAKPRDDMTIRWKSLGSEPIIAMTRGTTIRALIDAAAAASKTTLNIVLEPRLLPTAIAFAEQGFGSVVLPSTIMPIESLRNCRQYELAAPSMTRDISMIHLGQSPLSPAARAMREHILVSLTKRQLKSSGRRKSPARR